MHNHTDSNSTHTHICIFMIVIFVTPADMKNDSDVSASYGTFISDNSHTHTQYKSRVDDRW